MLLSCCINLVKLEKFLLSKVLGMTYNLERREYILLDHQNNLWYIYVFVYMRVDSNNVLVFTNECKMYLQFNISSLFFISAMLIKIIPMWHLLNLHDWE